MIEEPLPFVYILLQNREGPGIVYEILTLVTCEWESKLPLKSIIQ